MNCRAISVITLFPELVAAVVKSGVTGRAVDNSLLRVWCTNPRDFATDRHRTVDDRPFGGGPGMVMKVAPLEAALDASCEQHTCPPQVIYLSPQGQKLDHNLLLELGSVGSLVLIAGRYEGIDERFIDRKIDREVSIGDYVLSGGELAAMVVIDALARQIPGVLGHELSATEDSFAADGLLDCPHYTRPAQYNGQSVPQVLLDGNHAAIAQWRRKQSLQRTWQRRPELLAGAQLDASDEAFLQSLSEANKNRGSTESSGS